MSTADVTEPTERFPNLRIKKNSFYRRSNKEQKELVTVQIDSGGRRRFWSMFGLCTFDCAAQIMWQIARAVALYIEAAGSASVYNLAHKHKFTTDLSIELVNGSMSIPCALTARALHSSLSISKPVEEQ